MAKRGGDTPDLFEYAAHKKTREAVSEGDGDSAEPGERPRPLSVAELVARASRAVESALGTVWVEGEIASLSRAASGHLYFVLSDGTAEVRAVMWRSDVQRMRFRADKGMAVLCRAKPSIYRQGGKFQIYVGAIEPAGVGADALALEQLKRKLAAEGLFAPERKRPLPALPRRVGVVTSKSGAAVRDIIRATSRRFPVAILIADAPVQGDGAAAAMVAAIEALGRCDVDVIIIGRGGGSSSDLAAFNDEELVRAIARSPVPVVSAVGHEIDRSLTDWVADHSAATPTMAGEMVTPVLAELRETLEAASSRLVREMRVRVAAERQRLDQLGLRGAQSLGDRLRRERRTLGELAHRLASQHPKSRLLTQRAEISALEARGHRAIRSGLEAYARELGGLAGKLSALSPLRVLERGYAIATAGGESVTSAREISVGERLSLLLARGSLECVVESRLLADDDSGSDSR